MKDPDELLSSGYQVTQGWVALCKSWNGYLLAKRNGEREDMKQYAGQIRNIQREFRFEPTGQHHL